MALLDVIEWRDVTGEEMVHRWPASGPGTIKLGAQLTVRESQAAVFFRDGKALDTLTPGRHTLTTQNLPLLNRLVNLPFGGETPFQSEVYFVNLKVFTNLKWGTKQPIAFRDKELYMVRLRAFGAFSTRITQPQLFVNKIVGTEHVYTQDEVEDFLRNFIVARLNDTLGETMETVLDLPRMYDELGIAVRARLTDDMAQYGLELIDFLVEAITPPEEVQKRIDERTSMEALGDMGRYTQFQTAEAIGNMGDGEGGSGAAGTASVGAGLGAGMGMGAVMAQQMQQAMQPQPAAGGAAPAAAAAMIACAKCQAQIPAAVKFCPECGEPVQRAAACPHCGAETDPGAKFCGECGKPMGAARCPECQAEMPPGARFCASCGAKAGEEA